MQKMENKGKLNRNILLMGWASFFTDVASEMVYPLLQAFIAMVMATHKALLGPALGLIEGIAESTASLMKVFVGYYSDRIQRRKQLTIAGYGLSAMAKLLLFLATSGWYFVLMSRLLDRVGKGIRTAPRDALIAESTSAGTAGRAFGFHRAMDFAGATLGVLLCYLVSLRFLDTATGTLLNMRAFYWLFAMAFIPALVGVAFLFGIREGGNATATVAAKPKPRPNLNFRGYDRNLRVFFLAQLLFTLGNSSNQFLLLRSMSVGHALSSVILMYMVFNLTSAALATYFGGLADRVGKRHVLVAGYLVYTGVYLAFAWLAPASPNVLWICWIVYGVYYAMTEGVEKAFVANMAPADSKATALGFYHTIVGVGLLPASIIAGLLFAVSPGAPFVFGGVMSLAATLLLLLRVKDV